MYKVMLADTCYFTSPDFGPADTAPGASERSASFTASLADRLKNLAEEEGTVAVLTDLGDVFHICFAEAAVRAREGGAGVRLHVYKSYSSGADLPGGYIRAAETLLRRADLVCDDEALRSDAAARRRFMLAEADLVIRIADPAPSCRSVKFTLAELSLPGSAKELSAYLAVVKSKSGASACYAVVFSDRRTLSGTFTFHGGIPQSEEILVRSILNPELNPAVPPSVIFRRSDKTVTLPRPALMEQAFSIARTQALFSV